MGSSSAQHSSAHAQAVADLHAQGLGCNEIARRLDVSPSTVSRAAKKLGLTFARGVQVEQAVEAKRVDNASRRADILARLYAEADAKLVELEEVRAGTRQWPTLARGEGGVEVTKRLNYVPPRDFQQVGQTIGHFAVQAAKLEAIDSPADRAARSLLGSLAEQLGIIDDPDRA